MPISGYFGGHGSEVMANMKKQYGAKKGKSVFYATANKKDEKPGAGPSHEMAKKMIKKRAGHKKA